MFFECHTSYCYGNFLWNKTESNMFTNDRAVFWYHDYAIDGSRVVTMTHLKYNVVKEVRPYLVIHEQEKRCPERHHEQKEE